MLEDCLRLSKGRFLVEFGLAKEWFESIKLDSNSRELQRTPNRRHDLKNAAASSEKMIYAFGDVPQFVMFICLHFCKSKQILAGK
jgi:hypothetical protein